MRAATPTSSAIIERLTKQLKKNREILANTVERMLDARRENQVVTQRYSELRHEVRQKLDVLTGELASARQNHPVPGGRPAPVLPQYVPGAVDPLDAARQKLHEAYATTGDAAVRTELMESYDGFARSLALKFRHREALDDLVQVARIGLLHAIDRFDPALGRPFPLFARITITGELKRHLRDKTWAMRVSRSLQEDYLWVMQAVDELTAEQSASPAMEAVAARCDMPLDRVIEAMELRVSQRTLSIDLPPVPTSDDPVIELGQEDSGFGQLENRELLAHLLARLSERDRRIVELRFVDEMTQSEIAAEIGVSQMCVSRVLARTLGRLRLWARSALN